MSPPPAETIQSSEEFDSDYASAPSEIQEAAAKEIERIVKAPDSYGYFYLGNWDHTRWITVGTEYGLTWQPAPIKILRLLPLPALSLGASRDYSSG